MIVELTVFFFSLLKKIVVALRMRTQVRRTHSLGEVWKKGIDRLSMNDRPNIFGEKVFFSWGPGCIHKKLQPSRLVPTQKCKELSIQTIFERDSKRERRVRLILN